MSPSCTLVGYVRGLCGVSCVKGGGVIRMDACMDSYDPMLLLCDSQITVVSRRVPCGSLMLLSTGCVEADAFWV